MVLLGAKDNLSNSEIFFIKSITVVAISKSLIMQELILFLTMINLIKADISSEFFSI